MLTQVPTYFKIMTEFSQSFSFFEKRSLKIARWANLFMAITGVVVAWVANADALLVDGFYSGVNFLSSLVAVKIGERVMRPWDNLRPFGYHAEESIYIASRSLIILGIFVYAACSAIGKIISYLRGEEISHPAFGMIVLYSTVMMIICFGLAYIHHYNWLKTKKNSDILKTEKISSLIDGFTTAVIAIAFGIAPFLETTPLRVIVPIIDSLMVLILVVLLFKQPLSVFLDAMGEIAGKSADSSTINSLHDKITEIIEPAGYPLVYLGVTKLGRFHWIMIYLNPSFPVTPRMIDQLNTEITTNCQTVVNGVLIEVVLTEP